MQYQLIVFIAGSEEASAIVESSTPFPLLNRGDYFSPNALAEKPRTHVVKAVAHSLKLPEKNILSDEGATWITNVILEPRDD